MKKYLFGVLAIALAIGFSAFSTINSGKKVTSTDFYYIAGKSNQRLEPGFVTTLPTTERSITAATFKDLTRWDNNAYSFTPYGSDGSSYIAKMSFDHETSLDGDNDGTINLQEAVNAVWSAYSASNSMPASVFVDADGNGIGVTVNITKKDVVTP